MINKKLAPAEYEKLKVFIGLFDDLYVLSIHKNPEHHPLLELARIQKEHGLAKAKHGVQMAINDMVEDTASWRPEAVAEADAKFASAGTFTLTEVRRRYSKKYLQILKLGAVRSETDYYLLKGILNSGGVELDPTEAAQIQKMLDTFEAKIMQIDRK